MIRLDPARVEAARREIRRMRNDVAEMEAVKRAAPLALRVLSQIGEHLRQEKARPCPVVPS